MAFWPGQMQTQSSLLQDAAWIVTLFGHVTPQARGRVGRLNKSFPIINNNHNPCRTKAQISISKEKGECPLHAPLTISALLYTVLVTLVTSWAECRSGSPAKLALILPHNSPWWWLTLLFMERAGGSNNTLQIISHHRSPLYSLSTPSPWHISHHLRHYLCLQLSIHICK